VSARRRLNRADARGFTGIYADRLDDGAPRRIGARGKRVD